MGIGAGTVPSATGISPQLVAVTCRPVACTTAGECPQFVGDPYKCEHGLCKHVSPPDNRVHSVDALGLCLANVPRPASCSIAASDATTGKAESLVEAACGYAGIGGEPNDFFLSEYRDAGSGCFVPAQCRQL